MNTKFSILVRQPRYKFRPSLSSNVDLLKGFLQPCSVVAGFGFVWRVVLKEESRLFACNSNRSAGQTLNDVPGSLTVHRMASEPAPCPASEADTDKMKFWETIWQEGQIGFHRQSVHPMLIKHLDKLNPDRKLRKILIPLCGKTLDMKWLAEQGLVTVGVEGVQQALDEFFSEAGLDKSETSITGLGSDGKLFQSKDGMIKLYCGDMLQFSSSFEGTFDAIWDRGSLVALDRSDVPRYAQILKDLLNVGGRLLVEVMGYDLDSMSDLDEAVRPPPPYAMFLPEMKDLFEPQCTIELIDRGSLEFRPGKDLKPTYYLIVKQWNQNGLPSEEK